MIVNENNITKYHNKINFQLSQFFYVLRILYCIVLSAEKNQMKFYLNYLTQ